MGFAVSLATPMSAPAADRARPAQLWRAYPLEPDAGGADAAADRGSQPAGRAALGALPALRDGTDTAGDQRLVQLVVLLALMYVAFLGGWYLTIDRAVRAGGVQLRRRPRSRGPARSAPSRTTARVPAAGRPPPATTADPWTCDIQWQGGAPTSRFQAVIASPDGRRRRVLAESGGVPWPPVDGRTPPTRELEAALGTLAASLVDAGWEPIPSDGSWTRRRFVWRHEGAPPTTIEAGGRAARR